MWTLKDKTQAVVEWAKQWEGFDEFLKLNSIVIDEGQASLVTDPQDVSLVQYIDGTDIREYGFDLRMILPWSDGYDQTNDNSMAFAVMLQDWVVKQNEIGNYPDWGNALITNMQPTQTIPKLNMVYQEDALAEYLIHILINYEE